MNVFVILLISDFNIEIVLESKFLNSFSKKLRDEYRLKISLCDNLPV